MYPTSLCIVRSNLKKDQVGQNITPNSGLVLKTKSVTRFLTAAILFDAIVSISALAIGILGLFSVFHGLHGLPPCGAYSLIGVSAFITLMWTCCAIITKGKSVPFAKDLLLGRI